MGSPRKLIIVASSEHGIVLINFLSKRLALSNKAAKRLLDARSVFVNNGRVWMARHILVAGDRVEVIVDGPSVAPATTAPSILYEDDDYLVIDKPAGLLANGPQSAESLLRTLLRREVYAVHRLDRETSGCLLLAKTVAARDALKPAFQARELTKTYHALVIGKVDRARQTIREPIDGQDAVSHARVLRSTETASLLELDIETGRTHQIRKHLSSIRHPIIGDKAYVTRAVDMPALRHVSRQMLHASRLAFTHPRTGKQIAVVADLPRDFKSCQATLALRWPPSDRREKSGIRGGTA